MFQTIEKVLTLLQNPQSSDLELRILVDDPNVFVEEIKTIYKLSSLEHGPSLIIIVSGEEDHGNKTIKWSLQKNISASGSNITLNFTLELNSYNNE
jgi:hypothetical protein